MPFVNIPPRCNRPFSSTPAPSPHNVDQVSQSVLRHCCSNAFIHFIKLKSHF